MSISRIIKIIICWIIIIIIIIIINWISCTNLERCGCQLQVFFSCLPLSSLLFSRVIIIIIIIIIIITYYTPQPY